MIYTSRNQSVLPFLTLKCSQGPEGQSGNWRQGVGQDVLSVLPTQEDRQVLFYDKYCKEAEKYDRGFMKQYDKALDSNLIFVSFV